jgi:hypothetical protein
MLRNNISVRYNDYEMDSSVHGTIEKGEIRYSSDGNSFAEEASKEEQTNTDDEHQNHKGENEASNSDSDDGNFFDNAADEKEQLKLIQNMNEEALFLNVCGGVSDGERMHHVVCFDKIKYWYVQAEFIKFNIEFSYKNANRQVPLVIENLTEHKLREEYSPTNQLVQSKSGNYPQTRFYTVITTSKINPNAELEMELKRFTKKFKGLLSGSTTPSPGRRFMNFQLNSGNERILTGCKKYMGDDNTAVEDIVNNELIELGKLNHKYDYGHTLDKALPDYYIKKFLEDYLNATSWDSVSDAVKKMCYKNFPARQLPNWNHIRI